MIIAGESIDDYHANAAISNTKLGKLRSRGAGYYKLAYIDRVVPNEDTAALRFGRFFDDFFFDGKAWSDRWVIAPEDLDMRTKEGKAFKEAAKGRRVVSAEEGAMTAGMANAILDHPFASVLLQRGDAQVTIRRQLESYGLMAQARPDWYNALPWAKCDGPYTVDLKTTADFSEWYDIHDPDSERGARPILKFGYHRQAALVNWLLREETGKDTLQFLVVVEKQIPYRVGVVQLNSAWIQLGMHEVERDLSVLAYCYAANEWECSPGNIIEPAIPAWYLKNDLRAAFWNS